ncbi:MAG: tryptophan synthase subunit alpha, partial [Crocinitomicaceae bacterium]
MNPFKKENKQVSIFTTAGFPNRDSLSDQFDLFNDAGIDFIEVGIPFSDPLADGPVIQETSAVAIQNGMTIDSIFEELSAINPSIPVVLMGYINPVMNYGFE